MSREIKANLDTELAPPTFFLPDETKLRQVRKILEGLTLSGETVEMIRKTFESEVEKGLREEPSSLQMENTYIPELPDGTATQTTFNRNLENPEILTKISIIRKEAEEGSFLALDLGGTNFRVLLAHLKKGRMENPDVKFYDISECLRLGTGAALFDHIASCLCDFLRSKELVESKIPLGFTFSFPMKHHSLNSGVLVSWTKTFNCSDVVGKDVVQMLNNSLIKKGCSNVTVDAILNDTTGTLMMGALLDKKTSIGLVVGTGMNACYLEKAEKVKHWETARHGEKEVIIDIECGAFGDNGVLDFLKTEFDRQLDNNSLLVNSFTFEKYVSGKYLGELVRLILVKMVKENLLFGGHLSRMLDTPETFASEFLSTIEEDFLKNKFDDTFAIFKELDINNFTEEDAKLVQYVGRVVINRSAVLVSICLTFLIERIDKKEVTIAATGSVYEKHPAYRFLLDKYIRVLTKKKFKLMHVSDGSGKGATVAVAIAKKLADRYLKKQSRPDKASRELN